LNLSLSRWGFAATFALSLFRFALSLSLCFAPSGGLRMEVADATDVGLSPSTPKGKEFQIPVISFNTLPAAPKRKPVWSRMEVGDVTNVGLSPSTPKGKEFQIPGISSNTPPAAPKRKQAISADGCSTTPKGNEIPRISDCPLPPKEKPARPPKNYDILSLKFFTGMAPKYFR
jgi:hypothetical protein